MPKSALIFIKMLKNIRALLGVLPSGFLLPAAVDLAPRLPSSARLLFYFLKFILPINRIFAKVSALVRKRSKIYDSFNSTVLFVLFAL